MLSISISPHGCPSEGTNETQKKLSKDSGCSFGRETLGARASALHNKPTILDIKTKNNKKPSAAGFLSVLLHVWTVAILDVISSFNIFVCSVYEKTILELLIVLLDGAPANAGDDHNGRDRQGSPSPL